MLHELERGQFEEVLPLFQGYLQDPMMHAVIEGTLRGRVWVNDTGPRAAALVWTGTECAYLAGGEKNDEFNQALHRLVVETIMPAAQAAGCEYLSLFSFPESYAPQLENLFIAQAPLRTPLSTFDFDQVTFLERYGEPRAQQVAPLRLKRIGAEELKHPKHAYLAEQVAAYWESVERFLDGGCGYCVLEGADLLSWCYVQAYGHGAQTLDIWTAPSHRRQGLGTLVGAAVIGTSLEQGYTPFWICDRENAGSRKLAERLGFVYRSDICLVDIPFAPYRFYLDLAKHFFLPQGAHRQAAEAFDRAFSFGQGEAEDYNRAAEAWALAGELERSQAYRQKSIQTQSYRDAT